MSKAWPRAMRSSSAPATRIKALQAEMTEMRGTLYRSGSAEDGQDRGEDDQPFRRRSDEGVSHS